MKAFTTLSALVALAASASAQLMVNTPTGLTTCEPSLITWTPDGQAPYILSIVNGGTTTPNLKEFPPQSGNSYSWIVDIAAGQSITFALKDNQGLTVYSGMSSIQAGTSTSCVNATVNEGTATSSSVAGATGAPAATGSTTGASTGSNSGSTTTTKASTTGSTTGSASTQTQSKSGAAATGASAGMVGLAGVMGLVGALLF